MLYKHTFIHFGAASLCGPLAQTGEDDTFYTIKATLHTMTYKVIYKKKSSFLVFHFIFICDNGSIALACFWMLISLVTHGVNIACYFIYFTEDNPLKLFKYACQNLTLCDEIMYALELNNIKKH